MSRTFVFALVISSLLSILSTGNVSAHHFCLSDPNALTFTGSEINVYHIGPGIKAKWDSLRGEGGDLGCAITSEQAVQVGEGTYAEFENGQIVWSPKQQMIVAAYVVYGPRAASAIKVDWNITGQYRYDFFIVRWDKDGSDHGDDGPLFFNCDFIGIKLTTEPDKCWQQDVKGNGLSGSYSIPVGDGIFIPAGQGTYRIVVEGCESGGGVLGTGLLASSDCNQGWSSTAFVDVGYIDIAHKAGYSDVARKLDSKPLLPKACNSSVGDVAKCKGAFASPSQIAPATSEDIANVGFEKGCKQGYDKTFSERSAFVVLSKLYMAKHKELATNCIVSDPVLLRKDANDYLRSIKEPEDVVGTEVGAAEGAAEGAGQGLIAGCLLFGPIGCVGGAIVGAGAGSQACSRPGNYDFTLRVMIPLMFEVRDQLDKDVDQHVLHDLLTAVGGRENVRTQVQCAAIVIPESENHILMTESSRYLTNQLLLNEAQADPRAGAVIIADGKYDNKKNGMDEWMLEHLQGFFKSDFHEYNSRPYASHSIDAIHNLAEYAGNKDVQNAAIMLMDYLAAKYAVSNNGERRVAPFRRHFDVRNYTPLFGQNSEDEQYQFLALSGDTQLLDDLKYGHASIYADGVLASTVLGHYQIPPLILDLILNKEKNPNPFYQTFYHEAREVYAGTDEYLISGGGVYAEKTDRDKSNLGAKPFSQDTNGAALPTTLMPSWAGIDRNEFIRIAGSSDDEKRQNTCVAPGFACGLNPVIPDALLQRFVQIPGACTHPVFGLIKQKWDELGGRGVLGCPTEDERNVTEGDGRVQNFERGQILWSKPQKIVIAAWQASGRTDFALNWNLTDEFDYDYFNLSWENRTNKMFHQEQCGESSGFDGYTGTCQWKVESDDANASRTGGGWFIVPSGFGQYRIGVQGCESGFWSSSCDQGWTSPIIIDLPSLNSCSRAVGDWRFLDLSDRCGAPPHHGFYVALFSARCADDECKSASGLGDNGQWGFFALADPYDPDPTFDDFVAKTLKDNGGREFAYKGTNHFQMLDGRQVNFTMQVDGGKITSVLPQFPNGSLAPLTGRLFAQGDIIEADGLGCIVIKNPAMNRALVLDMRNTQSPQRSEQPLDTGSFCMKLFIPPTEIKFTADQTSVISGQCTTLRWQVTNATQAFLDGQAVTLNAEKQDCPKNAVTHVLRVTSLDNVLLKRRLELTVLPAPTPQIPPTLPAAGIGFFADQTVITRGQCTTIHWQTVNVSQVFVDGQATDFTGARQDCPSQTVTHTMRAITLDNQTVDRTLTIQVVAAPPTLTPTPTNTPSPTFTSIPSFTPTRTRTLAPPPTATQTPYIIR